MQVGEIFCRYGVSHEAVKILHQVFLTRLPEREAIDGQAPLEPLESADLAAERQHAHAALDLHRTFVNPVGDEVRAILSLGASCGRTRSACLQPGHDLAGDVVVKARPVAGSLATHFFWNTRVTCMGLVSRNNYKALDLRR